MKNAQWIPSKNKEEDKGKSKDTEWRKICAICMAGFLIGALLVGIPFASLLTIYIRDRSTDTTSSTTASTSGSSTSTTLVSTVGVTSSTSVTSPATTSGSSSTVATTTTAATTTTTTAPSCSSSGRGAIATFSGTTPTSWSTYYFNFTAASTTTVLLFGFVTEAARYFNLDDVSVVDVNAPGVQLLNNPSFQSSPTVLIGWTVWCLSTCSSSIGIVYSGSDCYASTGSCFKANCVFGIGFLGQSFPTVVGNTYTISFRLIARWGLLNLNKFYVDVA